LPATPAPSSGGDFLRLEYTLTSPPQSFRRDRITPAAALSSGINATPMRHHGFTPRPAGAVGGRTSGYSAIAHQRRGAACCKRPAVRTPVDRRSIRRWVVRRLRMPMSVYFDGQAQDANAGHDDDIFNPCCAIVKSHQPFNAIQKIHCPTPWWQNRKTASGPARSGLIAGRTITLYIKPSSGFCAVKSRPDVSPSPNGTAVYLISRGIRVRVSNSRRMPLSRPSPAGVEYGQE